MEIETLTATTIRQATLEDKEAVKNLIKEFHEESLKEFSLSFDWDTIDETIQDFIINRVGLVAEKDGKIVGAIGGVIAPSMFDKNQNIGQEAIWYVTKEERRGSVGIRLLIEFEKECKRRGADLVFLIHMSNLYADVLDRLYKMRNYNLLELHYIKEV